MWNQAFAPLPASGNLAVAICAASSTSAASVTLRTLSANNKVQCQISNVASDWLYINFGQPGLTAAAVPSTTNIPIVTVPAGCVIVYSLDPSVTTASFILNSGSGTVVFNLGEGM